MTKAKIEKVKGTVEVVVAQELDVYAGFTSEESINAIKNPGMKKQVKAFRSAVISEAQSKWKQALAIGGMTIEMRKEFGDDRHVAEFLGMSKGNFSKMQRAGAVAIKAKKLGIELPKYDLFIELLAVENDKHGKQDLLECAKFVKENEMTREEVRDYVKGFEKKDPKTAEKPASKPVQAGESEKVEESTPESFASETEERWVSIVQITENELENMSADKKYMLIDDLKALLENYSINMNNVWIDNK